MKYSLSAVVASISIPRVDQPNSGETTSQPRMRTSAHSRSALIPCRRLPSMVTPSEYHSAARHSSVISTSRSTSPRSCQKG